jgi:hypothetical protein
MSRDYINDPAEDAAFSLRRISSTLDDILEAVNKPTECEQLDVAAGELAVMLAARIPARGDADDIGFEEEHEAIETVLRLIHR